MLRWRNTPSVSRIRVGPERHNHPEYRAVLTRQTRPGARSIDAVRRPGIDSPNDRATHDALPQVVRSQRRAASVGAASGSAKPHTEGPTSAARVRSSRHGRRRGRSFGRRRSGLRWARPVRRAGWGPRQASTQLELACGVPRRWSGSSRATTPGSWRVAPNYLTAYATPKSGGRGRTSSSPAAGVRWAAPLENLSAPVRVQRPVRPGFTQLQWNKTASFSAAAR